ncbi:WD40/YVTN/BNR-like repeat-containing protein [Chryseobacterium sp. GP-SGM7]|uniref:WD40/YVTN/BNR-like repeat-containing protein n=1 Tax=Chryseobacterium sp. GP-SGM7 TaxID=3411323 RepID=UPI003B92CB3B
MKKILPFLFSFLSLIAFSQQIVSFENVLNDKINIRAIELYDNKVWYSGTDSKFGYVDLKNTKNQKQIRLSEKKLQFRTLAQDKKSFYAINIESPAYFFKIDKEKLSYEIVFTDTVKTAFYDALHFMDGKYGLSFSDPEENLNLKIAVLLPEKKIYDFFHTGFTNHDRIKLNKGEAAFAASNTNISSYNKTVWIATGGKASRIFKMRDLSWEVFSTPFIQGESSQGIYSIDFADEKFGVAVGGDYTKQEANINNIATTNDGGETWQIQASGKNAGYMTCVKIKPDSKGKEMVAVGDQHISYSSDFGKTWKKISDEKGFYVCKWVDKDSVVFAGKDKISVMKLKF